jgi:hypothetical protein
MEITRHPTIDQFAEAFIAALVDRGIVSIDPNSEATNLGISRVHNLLAQLASSAEALEERRWLTRVKNIIAPSNIGTNDYFLAALRSCQLGFAASPNPRYSEIALKLSKPHARHFLSKLQNSLQTTAFAAADAFLAHEPQVSEEEPQRGKDAADSNSGITEKLVWEP